MQIHGFGKTAKQSAIELNSIWAHLDEEERAEQVEAHLESEGFGDREIAVAMEDVGLSFFAEFYHF